MPCAYPQCKDSFQAKKGIKCENCSGLFHRKCVKKPANAVEFLCSQCAESVSNSSSSKETSLNDTSFLDFSDYEQKISQLEQEVLSLRSIIEIKDQEIKELKEKTANQQIPPAEEDTSRENNRWEKVTKKRSIEVAARANTAIPTSNRFQPLEENSEKVKSIQFVHGSPAVRDIRDVNSCQVGPTRNARKRQKKKVLLLADSNGRYCGDQLQNGLGDNFEVCTIFKPSAKINQVIENVEHLTKNFTQEDVVIIHAGSNDLPLQDQETAQNISQAMRKLKNLSNRTKVIVNSIPARYDDYLLHQKVRFANNLIEQAFDGGIGKNIVLCNQMEKMGRDLFAKDGLHYNRIGKAHLCERLVAMIKGQLCNDVRSHVFYSRTESAEGT